MGNQYSITVSDGADKKLKALKEMGYMPSRVIDSILRMLDRRTLAQWYALRKLVDNNQDGDKQ